MRSTDNKPESNRPKIIWWRFLVGALAGFAASLPLVLGLDSIIVSGLISAAWAILFGFMFSRPSSRPVDRRRYLALMALGVIALAVGIVAFILVS